MTFPQIMHIMIFNFHLYLKIEIYMNLVGCEEILNFGVYAIC